MGMGFALTWLRQVSPHCFTNHFNHWSRISIRGQPRTKYFLASSLIIMQNLVHCCSCSRVRLVSSPFVDHVALSTVAVFEFAMLVLMFCSFACKIHEYEYE